MVTVKKWGIAVAVAAIAVTAYFIFSSGDAARIKKQLALLSQTITKTADENQLTATVNAKRATQVCTATVQIHAPAYDYRRALPAAELPALILSARAPYDELSLDFYDETIVLMDDHTADVRVTSRLRGRLTSGDWVEDIQELHCRFREIDDEWRIAEIEVVEVLEP